MKVIQMLETEVTIRRFDTGENITISQNNEIEVDSATGYFLLSMKAKDLNGNEMFDIKQTEL